MAFQNVRSDNVCRPGASTHEQSYKLKTFGFMIAIILGLGALAVAIAGVFGYFHVGALSNIAQINAILMMAVGGSGGLILLTIGTVFMKNRQGVNHQPRNDVHFGRRNTAQKTDDNSSLITLNKLVYGPDEWQELGKKWNPQLVLEVADNNIPEAPKGDVPKGKVRIYIPEKVRVNGDEKAFTLNNLIEMGGGPLRYCPSFDKERFGNSTASGWIDIDIGRISDSRSKSYAIQKEMVEKRNCRMPCILEAVVANLMVFAFTNVRLYSQESLTYATCSEKDEPYNMHLSVGGFDSEGLYVGWVDYCSAVGVQKY